MLPGEIKKAAGTHVSDNAKEMHDLGAFFIKEKKNMISVST